jgi:hypothetical protein
MLEEVLVPFLSFFIFFALLQYISDGRSILKKSLKMKSVYKKILAKTLVISSALVFIYGSVELVRELKVMRDSEKPYYLQNTDKEFVDMMFWIRENTPVDAVFLVDPAESSFYVGAHRAVFVSYKHMKQHSLLCIRMRNTPSINCTD